jgi:protease II
MGVIVNEAPRALQWCHCQVPFVDVMTTMLMIVFRLQQGNMMNGESK